MWIVYPLQALLISLGVIELLRRSAKEWNLVDRPNYRKLHAGEVPVVGGIGIFLAFFVSAIVVPGLSSHYGFLFFPALFLTVLGVVDDVKDLRAIFKLFAQIFVAASVIALKPDLAISLNLTDPFLERGLSWSLTIFVLVGAMNAFNMMDGVDGLAGAVSFTALAAIMVAAALVYFEPVVNFAAQLLMPVAAFLFFNARAPWRRAAVVFLGDAGSMLLGFGITVLGLQLASLPGAWSPMAFSFIVALPAIDTASLIVRRLARGRSPLAADREHMHHLLLNAGLSPGMVTTILAGAAVLMSGTGLALGMNGASAWTCAAAMTGFVLLHSATILVLKMRAPKSRLPAAQAHKPGAAIDAVRAGATGQAARVAR